MEADVIISWGFAPVPEAVKSSFERPTKYLVLPTPPNRAYGAQVEALGWPYPVRTAIQKYLPGVTPLRIAVLGFSESCHGVRNLLRGQDAAYVDAVIAIDGIHTPFVNKNQVDPNTMAPWINHAKYAVVNERLFVGTHSSVVPPGYASTTQTCAFIWRTLTGSDQAFTSPAMPDMSIPPTSVYIAGGPATGKQRTVQYPAPAWLPPKRAGGLVIIGAANVDGPGTADHIYQAKYVLPLVLKQFLAARWNAIDPKNASASCFVGGPFGSVGSLSSNCASSFTVPASFIQSGIKPEPLPEPKPLLGAETGSWLVRNKSLVVSGLLVGAGTLGLYFMSKKPALAYRANPGRYTVTVHGLPGKRELDEHYDGVGSPLEAAQRVASNVYATPSRPRQIRVYDRETKRAHIFEHTGEELKTNDGYSPFPSAGVDPEQLRIGTAIEAREHGMTQAMARKTALEHLAEDDQYYTKIAKMEKGTPMYGWDALVKW